MTKKAAAQLIAELEALREEVRRLREAQASHICYHYTPVPWQPAPLPLPVWVSQPLTVTCDTPTNWCAGGAAANVQTLMLNAGGN